MIYETIKDILERRTHLTMGLVSPVVPIVHQARAVIFHDHGLNDPNTTLEILAVSEDDVREEDLPYLDMVDKTTVVIPIKNIIALTIYKQSQSVSIAYFDNEDRCAYNVVLNYEYK